MLLMGQIKLQSTLSYADTPGKWKKCPLVELSAYKNYSHKQVYTKEK